MNNSEVGAGILSIITESLYDNPIVIFREYVQNSVDSVMQNSNHLTDCEIHIWKNDSNLFFLDNGFGIADEQFEDKMKRIGHSNKVKTSNLGYKGIGRLSGVPYCKELIFINIVDYKNNKFQLFSINCAKYEEIKRKDNFNELGFSELINEISECKDINDLSEFSIDKHLDLIVEQNTGFIVVLKDITDVIKNIIEDNEFIDNLQWLLPIDFRSELYNPDKEDDLFKELTTNKNKDDSLPTIKYCNIFYDNQKLLRPIKKEMLRTYLCKNNFKYAIGFHAFRNDKIMIDKANSFSGIRLYIDNMLLCDENELLQSLDNFGYLKHTLNGQLQSIKGVGAMIYITDKVNISANARRTFIEVTDNNSIEFLELIAEFVNTVYETRYALSNYASAKKKTEDQGEKLNILKTKAIECMQKLATENVSLPEFEEEIYEELSEIEKKKRIKKNITTQIDRSLKNYLEQNQFDKSDLNEATNNFFKWLIENNK